MFHPDRILDGSESWPALQPRPKETRSNPKARGSQLPDYWYRDELIREEVYASVRALAREGVPQAQIASRVGVSARGVGRILTREPREPYRCGAERRRDCTTRRFGECTMVVARQGEKCWWHRENRDGVKRPRRSHKRKYQP